ncbi:MAG: hypothetical protein ABSE46_21645 [Terracidiphilus sp.]
MELSHLNRDEAAAKVGHPALARSDCELIFQRCTKSATVSGMGHG